jgi:hypothetical protein
MRSTTCPLRSLLLLLNRLLCTSVYIGLYISTEAEAGASQRGTLRGSIDTRSRPCGVSGHLGGSRNLRRCEGGIIVFWRPRGAEPSFETVWCGERGRTATKRYFSQPMFISLDCDIRQNTFHMLPLAACGSSQHGVRLARWVARSELRRLPRAICICTVDWPTERTWKRKVPAQATDECANVWRSSFL